MASRDRENWDDGQSVPLAPKVLTITFEFWAPPKTGDIRFYPRVTAAADAFTTAVRSLATSVFPWADKIVVHKDWSYRWKTGTEEIKLPATDENTPETS